MKLLELITFKQPDSDTIITLQRIDNLENPPFFCERLVNGKIQERVGASDINQAKRQMKKWADFERKIKSTRL